MPAISIHENVVCLDMRIGEQRDSGFDFGSTKFTFLPYCFRLRFRGIFDVCSRLQLLVIASVNEPILATTKFRHSLKSS